MTDYIQLVTTTPIGEACGQLGREDYLKHTRLETRAYVKQLQRTYDTVPKGCHFKFMRCLHDFDTYFDIGFIMMMKSSVMLPI